MFRFSIRDVLWLTMLLAVALAWVLDRGRLVKQGDDDRAQVAEYKKHGLDRVLKTLNSPPPKPWRVIRHSFLRPLEKAPAWPNQSPPEDRTPWIERMERGTIHRRP
jgi:hypothetical protein